MWLMIVAALALPPKTYTEAELKKAECATYCRGRDHDDGFFEPKSNSCGCVDFTSYLKATKKRVFHSVPGGDSVEWVRPYESVDFPSTWEYTP